MRHPLRHSSAVASNGLERRERARSQLARHTLVHGELLVQLLLSLEHLLGARVPRQAPLANRLLLVERSVFESEVHAVLRA